MDNWSLFGDYKVNPEQVAALSHLAINTVIVYLIELMVLTHDAASLKPGLFSEV